MKRVISIFHLATYDSILQDLGLSILLICQCFQQANQGRKDFKREAFQNPPGNPTTSAIYSQQVTHLNLEPKRWPTAPGKRKCVRKYTLLSPNPSNGILKHRTVTSKYQMQPKFIASLKYNSPTDSKEIVSYVVSQNDGNFFYTQITLQSSLYMNEQSVH